MKQFVKLTSALVILSSMTGCALEAEPSESEMDIRSGEQAFEPGDFYTIYAFNKVTGSWRRTKFEWPATALPTDVKVDSFGSNGDIPFIWENRINVERVRVGTYGKTGDRLGKFFLDRNGDMSWNAGDTDFQFMSDPQPEDQPFVLTARYLTGGSCSSSPNSSGTGPMVGIKRGTTVYLDRDGNGIYDPNSCDLSGTIGYSGDIPVGLARSQGGPSNHMEHHFGLVRIDGSNATWFFDNNVNLAWNPSPGPDTTSPLNAFGDGNQAYPPTHPDCIATKAGVTVYHDTNCNRVWDSGDQSFPSVLPSNAWVLAGVDRTFQ